MAGLLVREARTGMTKNGSGPGALAGLSAAGLSWVASMSLVLSKRAVADQHWVQTLHLPVFLARMELSEIMDTLFRYSLYEAGLHFSLAFVLIVAGLAGALGGTSTSVLHPPQRGRAVKFSALVSSFTALLASTLVLRFGGEHLNRPWWLVASLIVGIAFAALLALAAAAVSVLGERLERWSDHG
jgi:hypothetical protein